MMVKQLTTGPKSLRKRIQQTSLISFGLSTGMYILIGMNEALNGGKGIAGWTVGLILWFSSVLLVPILSFLKSRVRTAQLAYTLVFLGLVPGFLVPLCGSLQIAQHQLANNSFRWIIMGLVLGIAVMPVVVSRQRVKFRESIEHGHLRSALNMQNATWSAEHDFAPSETNPKISNPGCLLRLLPWVGPAIGLSMSDIIGIPAAEIVMIILFLMIGYGVLYIGTVGWISRALEFLKIERELGRKITLRESRI